MKPSIFFDSIALATTCSIASPVALAAPAAAFLPVLQQMRRELPSGWVVRLPSNNTFKDKYIPVLFPWQDDIHIVFKYKSPACMQIAGTGSNDCVTGRIIFSKRLSGFQESGERIVLTKGVLAFYGEGEAATGIYRGVTWRQDNQIYTVNGRIPRVEVLAIASSMATQQPTALNERKLKIERKALDIQQIILELDSKGSTISTRDLLDGYEYLIRSSVEIGEILAIANKDYTLGAFFDNAGKITDSIAVARLIIDFANIHRSLRSGDKESAVVKLLEIGLSKNLMADIYLRLSGQDVKKDIATIFNVNKVLDLLDREIDGHFDNMPRIRELIQKLDPQSPYAAFEKELQDAGLWDEWQKYLTSDVARNYNSIFYR